MTFDQNLSSALIEEILDVIYKYHDSILLTTALGCLELAKAELIEDHRLTEGDEDED
jgi:hypothetical protein